MHDHWYIGPFYSSISDVCHISVHPFIGPWIQKLFGTYCSYSPILANPMWAYDHVWEPLLQFCNCNFMVAWTLYYPNHHLWVPESKCYLVNVAYTPKFGVALFPQTAASFGGWLIYGSQDTLLSVRHSWVQGLFGTYNSYTATLANLRRVHCQVRGTPIPTNYRVVGADGHGSLDPLLSLQAFMGSCTIHTTSYGSLCHNAGPWPPWNDHDLRTDKCLYGY